MSGLVHETPRVGVEHPHDPRPERQPDLLGPRLPPLDLLVVSDEIIDRNRIVGAARNTPSVVGYVAGMPEREATCLCGRLRLEVPLPCLQARNWERLRHAGWLQV